MKKVILIVGGGSGIGKATAESLLDFWENIYVADKEISFWEGVSGSELICKEVDVLDKASLDSLIKHIKSRDLTLSGFVYTVGVALTKPLQSMKPAEYEGLIELNTCAFLNLLGMLDAHELFSSEGASVVVVSSLVASIGARAKVAYAASKGALESVVRSLALEYAPSGIRLNAVAPGTVQTEMLDKLRQNIGSDAVDSLINDYPLGLGTAEDVANLVVFLLKEDSRWMTGNVYVIDGAFSSK